MPRLPYQEQHTCAHFGGVCCPAAKITTPMSAGAALPATSEEVPSGASEDEGEDSEPEYQTRQELINAQGSFADFLAGLTAAAAEPAAAPAGEIYERTGTVSLGQLAARTRAARAAAAAAGGARTSMLDVLEGLLWDPSCQDGGSEDEDGQVSCFCCCNLCL